MLSISELFEKAVNENKKRGFKYTYILVDLHGTVIKPNKSTTSRNLLNLNYYPDAKEVLQILTKREDIKLIMWSSSYMKELGTYKELFEKDGIKFDYIGTNPEVPSDIISRYSEKFYYDLGLDDKHGFEPSSDWPELLRTLEFLGAVKNLVKYCKDDEFRNYCEYTESEEYNPELCKSHIYHSIKKIIDIMGE